MQKIESYFKKYGIDFNLIQRINDIVLYKQTLNDKIIGYEIHRVRIAKANTFSFPNSDKLTTYPEREVLANKSEFGIHAWSFNVEKSALDYFQELLKNDNAQITAKTKI